MQWADVITVVVSTGVGLVLVEAGLRAADLGPWCPFADLHHIPVLATPDPELGWTNRPGHYAYDGITVTIQPDGSRFVPGASPGEPTWLMGGSFVFGFGLSDEQTLAAVLQAERPDIHVAVHAVPGWGTVQSALRFEQLEDPVGNVVYGLVDLHDGRNAAAWRWLHALDRAGRAQAWKAVPSVWWDGAQLVSRPPRAYRHWGLSEHVALVDVTERAWLTLRDRYEGRKSEATVQATLAWRDAVEARGGTFTPVLLHAPRRTEFYVRRFREEGMPLLDLQRPDFPAEGALADGHPDATVHHAWGRRLAERL